MASGPITSWQIDEETVSDFIFLGSKITADGDCSHEIKRRLLLGRKVMTNLDSILKSRDITLSTKVRLVKAMVFPGVMYGCESWTVKKAERRRIDAFELWCWLPEGHTSCSWLCGGHLASQAWVTPSLLLSALSWSSTCDDVTVDLSSTWTRLCWPSFLVQRSPHLLLCSWVELAILHPTNWGSQSSALPMGAPSPTQWFIQLRHLPAPLIVFFRRHRENRCRLLWDREL